MKSHLVVLFLNLFLGINSIQAQEFKIIKDTSDYILKEVDSAFYYSHGIKSKGMYGSDTNMIHKTNGVLTLPLDNGKYIELCDSFNADYYPYVKRFDYYGLYKQAGCYLVEVYMSNNTKYFWIDKSNGEIDTTNDYRYYSPNTNYYVNIRTVKFGNNGFISFVKHRTSLNSIINFNKESPVEIKWLNDQSFIVYSFQYPKDGIHKYLHKYYLVEIKH